VFYRRLDEVLPKNNDDGITAVAQKRTKNKTEQKIIVNITGIGGGAPSVQRFSRGTAHSRGWWVGDSRVGGRASTHNVLLYNGSGGGGTVSKSTTAKAAKKRVSITRAPGAAGLPR